VDGPLTHWVISIAFISRHYFIDIFTNNAEPPLNRTFTAAERQSTRRPTSASALPNRLDSPARRFTF
jgi:hypothetical protein